MEQGISKEYYDSKMRELYKELNDIHNTDRKKTLNKIEALRIVYEAYIVNPEEMELLS